MSKQKPPRTPPPSARAAAKAAKPASRAAPKAPARAPAPPAPRPDPSKALEQAIERLEASVAGLKRERDELTARLANAQTEIVSLDKARKAAIDRIDWVIDSLHTALQNKS